MVSDRKLANAMGGKTARACDNCIRKRARWYCAADDAFLCQNCDASVHSANPLARRHQRVRLKTSSLKPSKELSLEISVPSWHHGFTKKARTPRSGKHAKSKSDQEPARNPLHLVPEICSDEIETSHEDNEEQLLYRVPIFDPFVAELRTSANSNEAATNMGNDGEAADAVGADESKGTVYDCGHDLNQFHGSLPSEMELAEFAADVESLLGKGLDDESFDIEGLGLSECKETDTVDNSSLGSGRVKVEDEGEMEVVMGNNQIDGEIDMSRGDHEPFELSLDYGSPMTCEEEDNKAGVGRAIALKDHLKSEDCKIEDAGINTNKKISLNLDYDGVMSAWADQRSPWTTGERPELDSSDCWPDCLGTCGTIHNLYGEVGIFGHPGMMDGGREARVSRYREKRRTRLFSKKIRYEVRKLNAEKRPRMKGRFVKRANFPGAAAAAFARPLHTK